MTGRAILIGVATIACGQLLAGEQANAQATHSLKPTPRTVAWEYFDAKTPPVRRSRDKTVWNYDGGVLFETDGGLPNGVCFRVSGRLTSPEFFDNLKRINTESRAIFRRGSETVTQFPDELLLSYVIHDHSCGNRLQEVGTRTYLTREMISTLRLSLYWKHGVDLRPVKNITEVSSSVEPIVPFARTLAAELPKRFAWSWEVAISGAGVPLTDSLVLVFRAPGGRIAARVAARL